MPGMEAKLRTMEQTNISEPVVRTIMALHFPSVIFDFA
jgi:hypothetical protein